RQATPASTATSRCFLIVAPLSESKMSARQRRGLAFSCTVAAGLGYWPLVQYGREDQGKTALRARTGETSGRIWRERVRRRYRSCGFFSLFSKMANQQGTHVAIFLRRWKVLGNGYKLAPSAQSPLSG